MTYLLIFLLLHPLLLVLFTAWAEFGSKSIAAIALPIDVLLNFTTAWLIWGRPSAGDWTISKRLKHQQARNQASALTLAGWINDIKPGHI